MVEQRTENPCVGGSIPPLATIPSPISPASFAILLFVALTGCTGITPGTDDETITASVKTAIASDTSLRFQPITVTTHHAVVELTGTVDSNYSKDKTGRYAKDVKGVKAVKNELTVR